MAKAYSYIRFSKPEQMKGDSLARQIEKSKAYCNANGLELDTELNLKDLGISAFNGKNLDEDAALGGFIKAIDEGRVKRGSYLLIESLDRLSRQRVIDAFNAFQSIIKKGITIVTLSDNNVYNEESINDFNNLLISLASMARAHEESKIKSMRLLEANRRKRENIKNKKLTSICPAWLSYDKKNDTFKPIPEKVKVVELIFELSASGMGTYAIITELNNRNIKPIARSDKWQQSYLTKILKGREVLGELISNSKDGKKVFENYYPPIIDEDLYYRVQKGIESRRNSGGGRKGSAISNIFQKLLVCGYSLDGNISGYRCDGNSETVILANKSSNNKKGRIYLQCFRNKRSNSDCQECRKLWRHDHFEKSFLKFVKEVDISTLIGTPNKLKKEISELENRIITAEEKLKHTKEKIKKITDAMLNTEGGIPEFLIKEGKALEAEEVTLTNSVRTMKAELNTKEHEYKNSDTTTEKLHKLIELMPTLSDDELKELRQRLNTLLKSIIERIEVYSCGSIMTDEYIKKIRNQQGDEEANILLESKKQAKGHALPYFIVRFKSGNHQLVATDPDNPEILYLSLTPELSESDLLGKVERK